MSVKAYVRVMLVHNPNAYPNYLRTVAGIFLYFEIFRKALRPSLIPRSPADNVTRVKEHNVSATLPLPSSDAIDNCGTQRADNNSSNFQNGRNSVMRAKNLMCFGEKYAL